MLGRQVGSALLRFPLCARLPLPLPPPPFQCPADVSSRTLLLSLQRPYATARGKPKKAVGEPSKPVKRAVKRAAKAPATGEAGKQVRARKSAVAAAAKTKPKSKKVAAKKKPAPKRIKKELTPEQLQAKNVRAEKAKISELKKTALVPPSRSACSAYIMYAAEKMKNTRPKGVSVQEEVRSIAQNWKTLSPAELEHYNHLAVADAEERLAAYKRFVESYTPEQIQQANTARAKLRRKIGKLHSEKWSAIRDERRVKRPINSFVQFAMNRNSSGDFRNILLKDRGHLIAQEWKSLSESEKKKYKDLTTQEQSRYLDEYKTVYGSMPPTLNHGAQAQVAATA